MTFCRWANLSAMSSSIWLSLAKLWWCSSSEHFQGTLAMDTFWFWGLTKLMNHSWPHPGICLNLSWQVLPQMFGPLVLQQCDSDNLNTTQTPEYTKDKCNVKIIKWKGLSQGPTNNLHRLKDEMKKKWIGLKE
jgi:hypothetical protein